MRMFASRVACWKQLVVACCLMVWVFGVAVFGLERCGVAMGASQEEEMVVLCSYRLENAFMPQRFVEMRVFPDGRADVTWAYYDRDRDKTYHKALQLSPEQVTALTAAYEQMDFLHKTVTDLNADRITVTDVGTTTLTYRGDQGERTLRYGYVEDSGLAELVRLYWQILRGVVPGPSGS